MKYEPQQVSAQEMAFPDVVTRLMPPWEDIPAIFRDPNSRSPRNRLMGHWFFRGIKVSEWTPREGVDKTTALRHLKTILGSFAPKHEHKEAAVAYLLSLWFVRVEADGEVYE